MPTTMTVTRRPVTSSNIKSAGWAANGGPYKSIAHTDDDATPGVLEVEFMNGGIYRYYDVSHAAWAQLDARRDKHAAGPSFGQLFDASIKRAGYRFEKVNS